MDGTVAVQAEVVRLTETATTAQPALVGTPLDRTQHDASVA